jgi:hypothetical protein
MTGVQFNQGARMPTLNIMKSLMRWYISAPILAVAVSAKADSEIRGGGNASPVH